MPNMVQKKIKVLHLFNYYLVDTMNWAYNLISNMPDVEVHIGSPIILENSFKNSDFKFYKNPFQKRLLEKARLSTFGVGLPKKVIIEILNRTKYEYSTFLKKQNDLKEIDILHAHFADVGCKFLDLKRQLDKPMMVSFYGADYEYLPLHQPKYKKLYQQLFKEVELFLCEGAYGAAVLEKMGCDKEKIRVNRLGVNFENIPTQKRVKEKNHLSLLQIATFTEKKGHIYTITAFHEALKNCPDMTLTMVGGVHGKKFGAKNEVLKFIESKGISDKVTLLDRIDFSQLYDFMKDYEVFIHPSCYAADRDCEGGAPVILLNAQAVGIPIISTRHCDIPEEVLHEKTGLLCEEKDIDGLKNSIEYFYKMEDIEYQKFGKSSIEYIQSNFDIKQNSINLRGLYADLLSQFPLESL